MGELLLLLLVLAATGLGIAWPLLRLAAETGGRRYRETALQALEYERSLYRPDKHNWPDLREGATLEGAAEPHFMWAWCHGAPGIGLGRLAGRGARGRVGPAEVQRFRQEDDGRPGSGGARDPRWRPRCANPAGRSR